MCGHSYYSFYLRGGIRFGVEGCRIVICSFFAVAKVYSTSELTNNGEVDVASDIGSEWRILEEGGRCKRAGTEIAKG